MLLRLLSANILLVAKRSVNKEISELPGDASMLGFFVLSLISEAIIAGVVMDSSVGPDSRGRKEDTEALAENGYVGALRLPVGSEFVPGSPDRGTSGVGSWKDPKLTS